MVGKHKVRAAADREKADSPRHLDMLMLLPRAIRQVMVDTLGKAPHTGISGGWAASHGCSRRGAAAGVDRSGGRGQNGVGGQRTMRPAGA